MALSNLGNVLAVSFAHARLNQEFAKEGLLPFSRFWASMKPFNAPMAALGLHWIVTVVVLVAPPAGPAYNFIVDLYTYPGAWINGLVAIGLIWLRLKKSEKWESPFKSWLPVVVVYLLANVFLALVPFIPPSVEFTEGYPYFVFPVVGVGVLIGGVVYWWLFVKVWPKIRGEKIVAERRIDADGNEAVRYVKVKTR